MAEESNDEKTEAPSEKKRQDARERGTVAKSTEINSVIVLPDRSFPDEDSWTIVIKN